MKKFIFKEAKLLALRNQEVTIAELAVANVSAQVDSAKRAADMQADALAALSSEILSDKRNGFTHISQLAFGMQSRLEDHQRRLNAREEELSVAIKSLQNARMAVESLQTLETRLRKKYICDCQKQEQMQRDEFASRRRMMEDRHANA